jgi:phytoene dehydrogenase-like protein
MSESFKTQYDVVVIGGGHNGLTAAAYLARMGMSVLVLERQPNLGGAAYTTQVFPGVDARLSRYSYLLSMFPPQIMTDLGLRFESRKRAVASFTPTYQGGEHKALLVSNIDEAATIRSFQSLTGSDAEYRAHQRYEELIAAFADRVWPTLLSPLMTRQTMRERFDTDNAKEAWRLMIEEPLGIGIERLLSDDTVRGLIFSNAKIGVLTHPHDETLLQNRTYIYHVIGQGTGEWRVVFGGMGAVSQELARAAREAGAQLVTEASVESVNPDAVTFTHGDRTHTVGARYILANVAPVVLNRMADQEILPNPQVEGSVFKINLVLKRLPKLKAQGYTPQEAFTGTFHIDEGYAAMQASYRAASDGHIPTPPPGEMYCQTITDPSTLSPELREQGYHTLTLFGADLPARLFRKNNVQVREDVVQRYLRGLNRYLDEPIEDCLAIDGNGQPCIEAKSPVDLEDELGMPGGHIFHQDMRWPFVDDPALAGTWGVETALPNVFVCGSGAQRGGCVSGIPGHNAAMKVLECEGRR